MNFDVRTSILGLAIGNIVFGMVLQLFQSGAERQQHIPYLTSGKLLQGIGWLLLYSRGLVPDLLSFTIGNIVLICGTAYDTWAMYRILHRPVSRILQAVSVIGVVLICIIATPLSSAGRVALTSFTVMIFFALGGIVMLRKSSGESNLRRHIGWSMLLMVAVVAGRGIWAALAPENFSLFSENTIQLVMFATLYYLMLTNGFGMLLLAKDIADRDLRASEERFRNYFELPLIGIAITDPDKGWLEVNRKLCEMLGYTREELMKMTWAELTHPDDLASDVALFNQVMAGEIDRYNLEKRFMCKDGRILSTHLAVQCVRRPDHSVNYFVGLIEDITERKQAEEKIRQLNANLELRVEERTLELVQANRVKDEFLAMMSHELRTPLTGILGFSEVMLEGLCGPLNEKQVNAAQMVHKSGEHLLGIINDVLDISKIQAGNFDLRLEKVDVNAICKGSLLLINQIATRKLIEVEYSYPENASTIVADPRRLSRILISLLSNAVKFTPNKGRVRLVVSVDAETKRMSFAIFDTGIGIRKEDFPRLFQPFVQLDSELSRKYEGTGLGLVLVKKMTEMQGGRVDVFSEIGAGSCFTISMPWDPEQDPKYLQIQQAAKLSDGNAVPLSQPPKILVADDDAITAVLIENYLSGFGYQVEIAEDGRQVLPKAEGFKPDIILMDIQMPYKNGLDLTRQLRLDPRFADTSIVALTAFAMQGDSERCIEAGMDEYMSKPVRLSDLKRLIERILKERTAKGL